MLMRRLNLYVGFILFISFLITGLYMRFLFRPEHFDELTVRMEIRSNHIYILFVSLLNLMSFGIEIFIGPALIIFLDRLSRSLFIISGVLSLIAFVFEHTGTLKGRSFTFFCVLSSLSGVVLFLFAYALSLQFKKKGNVG